MKTTQARQQSAQKNGHSRPVLIAGPCSAESPRQLMETAKALALTNRVDYFRAGVWKPRTSPGSFEGVGTEALKWLQDVKEATGLKVATEAGNVQHAREALRHNIDMLWIGARTVSNPFVVQEIADTLKGSDVVVMVKNPMAPDVDLWAGSIKRFQKAGIKNVCAIHRGFSYWTRSVFRNHPWWHLPMELKKRLPDVPVICDPSHIAGDRKLVPMLSQRAMEMGFNGLMIEVHPKPENALSDASQQLTPASFLKLTEQLFGNIRDIDGQYNMLDELRAEVDVIDQVLIWALTNRMKLAGEIAGIKNKNNMETLQPQRWKQVITTAVSRARESGLRPGFIEKLFDDIHHESLTVQRNDGAETKQISGIRPTFAI